MSIIIKCNSLRLFGTPKWGVGDEFAINIRRFQVRYYPEVDEMVPGPTGNTQGRIVSQLLSRDIECEGEITGSGFGIMAFTVGAALNFSNNAITDFQPVYGSVYFKDATVSKSRSGWTSVTIRLSSRGFL